MQQHLQSASASCLVDLVSQIVCHCPHHGRSQHKMSTIAKALDQLNRRFHELSLDEIPVIFGILNNIETDSVWIMVSGIDGLLT